VTNWWLSRSYPALIVRWRGFPPPEARLPGAMLAAPALVVGCLWLGWTGQYADVHWAAPALATVLVGFAISLVFMSFLVRAPLLPPPPPSLTCAQAYLVDTYLQYSASAFAANTAVRSAVAAGFPLFTTRMFTVLGVGGACSLLAGVALLLAPSPFLFYKYGARIRGSSRFAPCLDLKVAEEMRRGKEGEKGVA
jgi:DHA1 family multidrug resistance protein-like MFS transporter